jgi:hypothetical protein
MVPILPIAIVALAGASAWAIGKRDRFHGEMTAERHVVFQSALDVVKEPEKLNKLADAFDKQGLKEQATLLRQRAKLRTLPKDVKGKRREIFRSAMTSTNIEAIRSLSKAFEKEGATGSARELELRARALEATKNAVNTGTA